VTYYGPPGSPADFAEADISIAVPIGGLPSGVADLKWEARLDTPDPEALFEIVQGASEGTLAPGESELLSFTPTQFATTSQGVVEAVFPFFDNLYGTREPVVHRAFVGVEGFTSFPDTPFDGEGGLGVPDEESRSYQPRNRWVVWQDVTVSTSADWITVDGVGGLSSPQTYALPPVDSEAPDPIVEVAVDATNLQPNTYVGSATFSSDDSGVPAFERTNEVVLDCCRQISPASGLPWVRTIAPGQTRTKSFVVSTTPPGATVADVDIVIEDVVTTEGPAVGARYEIVLEAPNGETVLIKAMDSLQLIYYDQDRITPEIGLNELEGGQAPGPWKLHFSNHPDAESDIEVTLTRWEVRLHTNEDTTCSL
jgi:hypothetical protein